MNKRSEVMQVSPTYEHFKKVIRCHGVIDPTISRLKWYEIARGNQPIEQAIRDLARRFDIVVVPVPFPVQPMRQMVCYHAGREEDAGLNWLRARIEAIVRPET
mgnify:CR=1 FL=1